MKIVLLIAASLLILGVFPLPIGYYTFLRITTTLSALFVIVKVWDGSITLEVVVFGSIAILFNPLFPVYLHNKSAWQLIDLTTALIFLIKALVVFPRKA